MCGLRCSVIDYIDSYWAGSYFPFQHMINVILAVVGGARFSVGAAFSTSCLRNVLALGSPLAFPGSMIGAWLSAYLYKNITPSGRRL